MSNVIPTINLKADQCVKCGLCLPHCPTYRLFEDENESPRGRIALIQALANRQIRADQKLRLHLAHCLGCKTCEQVCPSGVDYGYLLDHSRQLLNQQSPTGRLQRWLIQLGLLLVTNKNWQSRLHKTLYYYQKSGMQNLLRWSGILKLLRLSRYEGLLPEISYPDFKPGQVNQAPSKGRLGLFIGCTGELFDQQTLKDTIWLLQRLGYEVHIPVQQTCCGALHRHQGRIDSADSLARQNIQAFAGVDTIIYIASGCGAQLREYAALAWPDKEQAGQAESFARGVKEITAFLSADDLTPFHYQPLYKRVAIHTPCSMRNGLRQADASMKLLGHIPGLELASIPAETGCCGAAGSYMLSQPALASTFRERTLAAIAGLDVEIISTSNIGCGLHLAAGLPNTQRLMHPVSLLARQIID